MRTIDPRTGVETLDRDECLRLLAEDQVGRLAVVAGGVPTIFPVNYRLDDDAIIIRTDPGTKLDAGPRSRVCFEIDHFDREARRGWSVVVTGRIEVVTRYDAATFNRVRELPLDPWAGGEKAHWMRLNLERVTGRRVQPPET